MDENSNSSSSSPSSSSSYTQTLWNLGKTSAWYAGYAGVYTGKFGYSVIQTCWPTVANTSQAAWNFGKNSTLQTVDYVGKFGHSILGPHLYFIQPYWPPLVNGSKFVWNFGKTSTLLMMEYTGKIGNSIFQPSRFNTVMGYVPFIGNFVLLGSGIHAYMHGQKDYAYQKMTEAATGTVLDFVFPGRSVEGLKLAGLGIQSGCSQICISGTQVFITDIASRTVARVGSFQFIHHNIFNAPYFEYKTSN